MALKRITRELQEIAGNPIPCILEVTPSDENPFRIQIKLLGPSDTPYEGGIFFLQLTLPRDYPFSKPNIQTFWLEFISCLYHPSVDGKFYYDWIEEALLSNKNRITSDGWHPRLCIRNFLENTVDMMKNFADLSRYERHNGMIVRNRNAHKILVRDRIEFFWIAQEYSQKYADAYFQSIQSSTPLHKAVFEGNALLVRCICRSDINSAEARGIQGWTPVHVAAYFNRLEVMKELVRDDSTTSARIRPRTNYGHTALHLACSRGHSDMISLLLLLYINREKISQEFSISSPLRI